MPSEDMRRGSYIEPQERLSQRRQTITKKGGNNPFVDEIRKRIDMYFDIVLRNVKDSVPKMIGYFLVKKSQDSL